MAQVGSIYDFFLTGGQSPRSIIPRRINKKSFKTRLPGVSYTGDSISPRYHIPGESVILHLKFEWLGEILTKIENIFKPIGQSVAQADSNNEKMEVENLVPLSF